MDDLKLEGKWDQVKGRVKEAWGSLTDDDLDRTKESWTSSWAPSRKRLAKPSTRSRRS